MKRWQLAASVMAMAAATPAAAADFSFVGTLNDPNGVLFFDFTVGSPSLVTLRTYSYAGGTNAAGTVIARGGFDPILSLYDLGSGVRVGQNDDGGNNVPADAVTNARFDTFFQAPLPVANYRVAVTAFSNFAPTTLGGTFAGGGSFTDVTGDVRTNAFAFDVLNVDAAVGPGGAVPEPATWAMLIVGFGAIGGTMRRRKVTVRYAV